MVLLKSVVGRRSLRVLAFRRAWVEHKAVGKFDWIWVAVCVGHIPSEDKVIASARNDKAVAAVAIGLVVLDKKVVRIVMRIKTIVYIIAKGIGFKLHSCGLESINPVIVMVE